MENCKFKLKSTNVVPPDLKSQSLMFQENKGKEFLLIGNPKVQTRTKVKSSGKKMSVDSFPQTLIVRQSSELQS